MDHGLQRHLGLAAAKDANAQKTADAIKDQDKCYEDILNTAVSEAGLETVVQAALKNDPEWAYNLLRHIPDLGQHRESLLDKVATSPEWALHTLRGVTDLGGRAQPLEEAAGPLAAPLGPVAGFVFTNIAPYVAQFTMFWVDQGRSFPQQAAPPNDWIFSSRIAENELNHVQYPCSHFVLGNTQLTAGDEIWLFLAAFLGTQYEAPFRFTYEPDAVDYAWVYTSGAVRSPKVNFGAFDRPPS